MVSSLMVNEATPPLASLLEAAASGALPSAPPFEMSKPLRQSLASTGHLVQRFLSACDALRLKVQEKKMPELLPYFHGFDLTASPLQKEEGAFVCPLNLNSDTLKLQPLLLTAQQASQTVSAWHRVQLDAPRVLLHPLEIPVNANSPLWPTMLHLRPLRPFWEQQLRHRHVQTLLDRVPHAWMIDPEPLPPGAVIPKLELASWQDLPPERNFTIQGTASDQEAVVLNPSVSARQWHHSIDQALQAFGRQPQVLSETANRSQAILLGIYQRQNQRVDLIGGIAFHPGTTLTWQFSRW